MMCSSHVSEAELHLNIRTCGFMQICLCATCGFNPMRQAWQKCEETSNLFSIHHLWAHCRLTSWHCREAMMAMTWFIWYSNQFGHFCNQYSHRFKCSFKCSSYIFLKFEWTYHCLFFDNSRYISKARVLNTWLILSIIGGLSFDSFWDVKVTVSSSHIICV